MSELDKQRGIVAAEQARTELYTTLGQLKERLNYAKRVDDAVDRTRQRIAEVRRDRPVVFAAAAAGVAAAAGLVVWGVARALVSRR